MEYFKKHNTDINTETNTDINTETDTDINTETNTKINNINIETFSYEKIDIIENNRAIINDIVYIKENKVIGIKERFHHKIVGILYIDSKIKYGTIKDKTIYLFKPTNKQYPFFYVPYKNLNKKNCKIYVWIEFKKWDTTDKYPHGTLLETIGNVGDKEAEFEHLRYYYNVKNNTWKIDPIQLKEDIQILEQIQDLKEDYEVFSIDPIGSTDIDDAFHFKINTSSCDTVYEIGIHIASPTTFLKNSLLKVMERVSTIYLPNYKYNMIPEKYADIMVSLLPNKKRFAISLILIFDKDYHIISETINKTIVINKKNFHYDEYDKYDQNQEYKLFNNFSNLFFKIENSNSHKIVEEWMIFTNKKIATYLMNQNVENIILRKHELSFSNIDIELHQNNPLLFYYLKNRNENSAKYEIYNSNSDSKQTHSKLKDEYYTHFTSPIRRAVDFYIHLLLLDRLDTLDTLDTHNKKKRIEIDTLQKYIDKINIFTKNSRRFSRNVNRLEFLFTIKELEKNIETYAYIINIYDNKITIYIPEYHLEEKIILIPKKLEKITNITYSYEDSDKKKIIKIDYLIDNSIDKLRDDSFDNSRNDKKHIYSLYQRINIKLYVFTSFDNLFDKLKIEIL
jgi:exoribonuclease R